MFISAQKFRLSRGSVGFPWLCYVCFLFLFFLISYDYAWWFVFRQTKKTLPLGEALDLVFSLPDDTACSEGEYYEEPEDLSKATMQKRQGRLHAHKKASQERPIMRGEKNRATCPTFTKRAPVGRIVARVSPGAFTNCLSEPGFAKLTLSSILTLDAFELFFKEVALRQITQQTNVYARQICRPEWTDVIYSELRAYFVMLVLMSIKPLHHVQLNWSSDSHFNDRDISEVMANRRFQQITNSLHLSDNAEMPQRWSQRFDRCFKIPP